MTTNTNTPSAPSQLPRALLAEILGVSFADLEERGEALTPDHVLDGAIRVALDELGCLEDRFASGENMPAATVLEQIRKRLVAARDFANLLEDEQGESGRTRGENEKTPTSAPSAPPVAASNVSLTCALEWAETAAKVLGNAVEYASEESLGSVEWNDAVKPDLLKAYSAARHAVEHLKACSGNVGSADAQPKTATNVQSTPVDWDAYRDGKLTIEVSRKTLLSLFAGSNYSPCFDGPRKRSLAESMTLNALDHAAWLTDLLRLSEDEQRDHYACHQLDAAQELIEAIREAEGGSDA